LVTGYQTPHLNSKLNQAGLLSTKNISWRTEGNQILDDISFTISEGSFTGVIGPNGAGKSSLLRCLYRFIKPEKGVISFDGQDIWQFNANEYAKSVAVVLQETPSQFNLTVQSVVALGLIPHKTLFARESALELKKISQALSQVGLSDKALQNFEHLSGGEKQRALIARAIVQSPRLLIMDEPTSHLDVRYQIQIMQLAKSLGITVLASFHDLNLASAMCENILVLDQGKLICQGAPSAVMTTQMLSKVFGVRANVSEQQNKIPHISYHYDAYQSKKSEPSQTSRLSGGSNE
jgi:iron complex transport system ATP-binding protein